ncbi:hypothetical protein Pmani_023385 [Petrolisthes manimaculis]|uniref:Phosphomevalonate kinase n=1 Tax=Petrolisthes manimaculis TaxID=1843537 RepID=A0AAE1PBX6_9EUCA|nr:hypothetical protein Pmani_023385 [Petrolisthes manimaculis]
MASQQPQLIVLVSGKRMTGKDYFMTRLRDRLDNKRDIVFFRLSAPLEEEFAAQSNLDGRYEMVSFGEMKRKKDPGYFIRAAIKMFNAVDYPIWIVTDMRLKSDLDWFEEHYPNVLYTVRIESTEKVRKSRGYIFTNGVDDHESECNLDDYTDWIVVIHNNGANLRKELDALQVYIQSNIPYDTSIY